MVLPDAFCRNVAEAGRYADCHGLYLHVAPSGARRWVQRLPVHGRPVELGLGSFALVPLAKARERALANRRLAREGGDPLAGMRRSASVPTFTEAAAKVLAVHKGAWRKGSKTAAQWETSMRDHVFPHMGGRVVDGVTTADIMTTLMPIWTEKYVTARKVHHRISAVMRWAIAQGYRTDNPAGDAVLAALPRRSTPVGHHKALPHREVAGAVAVMRSSKAWRGVKLAFEFLVLTATRSAEVRLATWREVDLAAMGVDGAGGTDEGEARAPGAAGGAGRRGAARGREAAVGLAGGARTGGPGRAGNGAARVPVELQGLGVGADNWRRRGDRS